PVPPLSTGASGAASDSGGTPLPLVPLPLVPDGEPLVPVAPGPPLVAAPAPPLVAAPAPPDDVVECGPDGGAVESSSAHAKKPMATAAKAGPTRPTRRSERTGAG